MCELIRKNVVRFRCYGLGCVVRGKVGKTLYGCTNVERQIEVDNYPVNILSVNCIDGIKTIQMKDNFE